MTDSQNQVHGQLTRFAVGGARTRQGIVLVYPDKLAAVTSQAGAWGCFVGPFALMAIAYPFVHVIGELGAVIGVLAGLWAGEAIGKKSAARRVAADRDGVTVIPLDLIVSLQTRKSAGIGGRLSGPTLLVTTADGTEYGFRGKTCRLQADLATALTVRGGQVRVTPAGITVTPQPTR